MPKSKDSGYLNRERQYIKPELVELYAPRFPMTQLPDKYLVSDENPEPPLIHFAIPIDAVVLYKYADKHGLTKYHPRFPDMIAMETVFLATKRLSDYVECDIELCWPFYETADCGLLLALYSNYTMEDKKLVDEDEEDVVRMVQKALKLHKSLRPKWYFDQSDGWEPGDD